MAKLKKAHLLTGANLGDRIKTLTEATRLLGERAGQIVKVSSWYETEAWGEVNQPAYINQALEIATTLTMGELLQTTQQIELELGRTERSKWASRLIDIDILFYTHRIIKSPSLTIPHPHIHRRNFVLIPMMEIAPRKRHPIFRKTIEELYLESKDELDVALLEGE
ncbi:MAG: 2-amino-4-hydroxy-6-hydroxymethyldihydropteridine diphosphokinase [Bacteroidota bacterium]